MAIDISGLNNIHLDVLKEIAILVRECSNSIIKNDQ